MAARGQINLIKSQHSFAPPVVYVSWLQAGRLLHVVAAQWRQNGGRQSVQIIQLAALLGGHELRSHARDAVAPPRPGSLLPSLLGSNTAALAALAVHLRGCGCAHLQASWRLGGC